MINPWQSERKTVSLQKNRKYVRTQQTPAPSPSSPHRRVGESQAEKSQRPKAQEDNGKHSLYHPLHIGYCHHRFRALALHARCLNIKQGAYRFGKPLIHFSLQTLGTKIPNNNPSLPDLKTSIRLPVANENRPGRPKHDPYIQPETPVFNIP